MTRGFTWSDDEEPVLRRIEGKEKRMAKARTRAVEEAPAKAKRAASGVLLALDAMLIVALLACGYGLYTDGAADVVIAVCVCMALGAWLGRSRRG